MVQLNRLSEAMAVLDKAITRYPGDQEARLWRCEAFRRRKLWVEALADAEYVVNLRPGFYSLLHRALSYGVLNQLALMRNDFRRLHFDAVSCAARRLGIEGAPQEDEMNRVLEEILKLSHGIRHDQAVPIWLAASRKPIHS